MRAVACSSCSFDVLKSKKPLQMGATKAGSTTYDFPVVLNKLLGTNFEVISGYTGTTTIRIAMQKQEVAELLAEAKNSQLKIDYVCGKEIEK